MNHDNSLTQVMGESEQVVHITVSQTAWQVLEQQAQRLGVSGVDLIEHYAFHVRSTRGAQLPNLTPARDQKEFISEPVASLQKVNQDFRSQLLELQQTVAELRSREQQVEGQLRDSQQFIQNVADATPGILYIYDLIEQRNVYVNRQIGEVLGYSVEAVQAMENQLFPSLMHPDDLATLGPHVERFYQAQPGEVIEREYRMRHANGEWRWLWSRDIVFSRTNEGAPHQVIGISHDITARKQAELSLRQTEERLSLVLEATNDAIYDRNLKTGAIWWNQAYNQIFGERPPNVNTPSWWVDHIHPEDRERVVASFRAALAQDQDRWSTEYRFQRADGSYADVVDRACILRDDAGQPERYLGAILNVSHLKQVEENLRQTEERLQLALSSARTVAWDLDLRTHYIVCSANALDIWSMQEGTVEEFFALIHPEDRPLLMQSLEEALSSQEYYVQEYRIVHPNQTVRWLSSQGQIYRDSQGVPLRMVGVSVDISERKRAEDERRQAEVALQLSQERYRSLVEALPQLICLSDAQGRTTYCNQSWIDYTGLTLEETQSAKGRKVFHPEDYPSVIKTWQDARRGNPYSVEFRLKRWDGVYRWHLGKGVPLKAEDGGIVGWLGTTTDIDDRKRTEQKQRLLAQASQTFAAASLNLQTVLDTITQLLHSLAGDVCVLNLVTEDGQWLKHASCYHSDPEVRSFVSNLLNQYPRRVDEGIGGRVMQTGEPILMRVNSQAEFGTVIKPEFRLYLERFQVRSTLLVPLKVQGQPIGVLSLTRHLPADPHTQDDLMLVQDLADRAAMAIARGQLYKAEQEARAEAVREAERSAAANRTKDEFLAVLSHELRTPMNPILGWAKLLERGNLSPGRTAIALETIRRNAELQVQLIEDLLDISRILQGKLILNSCPVDLAMTIEAAIETVCLAAEAKVLTIQTTFTPDLGQVLGDAARLQQAIWNLLTNAVKFTPDGGNIRVTLTRVESYAEIRVIDTGQGIPPDFLPHVFDTFRQADSSTTRAFGGLGLGLAITRHIVELHGGNIQAESAGSGKGATFTVRLPLISTSTMTDSEPVADELPTLQGIRVLAVDDEIDNLELTTFILRQAGASVVAVSSAAEALHKLSQPPQPDLLLADIGMPQIDGYALLQQIRALPAGQGGEIPAIAITAYAGELNQQKALAAGFQRHVAKPIAPEELIKEVVDLLQLSSR